MNPAEVEAALKDISQPGYVRQPYGRSNRSPNKDLAGQCLSVLTTILSPPLTSAEPLVAFGKHIIESQSLTIVIGRRLFNAFAAAVIGGSGFDVKTIPGSKTIPEDDLAEWGQRGAEAFKGEGGAEYRQNTVEAVLEVAQTNSWYDEHVSGQGAVCGPS